MKRLHAALLGAIALLTHGAAWGQAAADPPVLAADYPLACSYASISGELDAEQACARQGPDGPVLSPGVAARLDYTDGLATYAVHGYGWYHQRRRGLPMLMYTFDNGPDEFAEGLARAIIDGKIAYVDRRLRVKLRTRYDWADRFQHGKADVCVGCRSEQVDGGEHAFMTGGRWGVIDRQGREVVPLQ